ncbi:MAG: co-chaperone GroES [Candidatus Taylorbacteria bacterium]|nr:co-chaperone GroES [Candidatus Taylorbacteria bacterium]
MAKPKKETGKSSSMKIVPLADKVLIRESKANEGGRTESGIIIPDSVREDRGAKKGVVVAVGPGKMEEGETTPVSVEVGNTVLFQWGDKIVVDGEEYEMVAESSILAIIK